MAEPILIGSEIFRTSRHAAGHPLAIPRVSLAIDLCRALGWLPVSQYHEARLATPAELERFHTRDYVSAVMRAEAAQHADEPARRRFNLGVNGNPVYGEVFRRPATACGASLQAARLLEQQGGVVYNPAGGTHHGQPDRASGYCIFYDPVLAILELLACGLSRVFYLDLDAHFGDGVQQAFHADARVFTLSIHEKARWPMARDADEACGFGGVGDRAGGAARNLPLAPGGNDSEFDFLIDTAVLPLIEGHAPDAIVIQAGADALADDPMTKLSLSNRALWRAIAAVRPLARRLLVLGGGGYNPWAVGRCWAGIWAMLNDQPIPQRLPAAAQEILRAVRWRHRLGRQPPDHWFTALADSPRPGPIRPEVRRLPEIVLANTGTSQD
jgi:acetoin utilization protein AcuC